MQRGCFRWISYVSLGLKWATHRFLPLGAVSSWGPGLQALGWVCPLGEGLVGGMKVVWLSMPHPLWIECFVWCFARERIHSFCEERCGIKQGSICQGLSPPAAPNLSPGAGSSPTFSFPLAARLFKVESVEPKSNHVQILKDGACSPQPVYIAFHDDLLLSLTAYFVCFLVSGRLIVNWWGEYLLLWGGMESYSSLAEALK